MPLEGAAEGGFESTFESRSVHVRFFFALSRFLQNGGESSRIQGLVRRGWPSRLPRHAAYLRVMNVTAHVAQNDTNCHSAIDGRTTCRQDYAVSQRKRKRVEQVFGWMKTVALQGKRAFSDRREEPACSPWRPLRKTW